VSSEEVEKNVLAKNVNLGWGLNVFGTNFPINFYSG